MRIVTDAALAGRLYWWLATGKRIDTHYSFDMPDNPKFMGAREAIQKFLGQPGLVVGTSGLGGNAWPSLLYRTIVELHKEGEIPGCYTFVAIGGFGSRGKLPGSLDEVGRAGLCTRFFTGHVETYRAIQELAKTDLLELQCLPQGVLALLLGEQAEGRPSCITTNTGLETFMDPSVGRGTPVVGNYPQYVERIGDHLKFWIPKIDVAIFSAPAADRFGNIYIEGAAILAESEMITKAARQNGGSVIVYVGKIVDYDPDKIFLPASDVDAIVFSQKAKQTLCFPYEHPLACLTTASTVSDEEGIRRVNFLCRLLGVTPKRSKADKALARLAAYIFTQHAKLGCCLDLGVRLPELVGNALRETGIMRLIKPMVESGVLGGTLAPGPFFGAAVNPDSMVSSTEAFRLIYEKLDAVILGALQVGFDGNVNLSKRGDDAGNYVGPGGAMDLLTKAQLIIFCCGLSTDQKIQIIDGRMVVQSLDGKANFVKQVDEVTFSAQQALAAGKKVFYVTPIGVLKLTPDGLQICALMPDAHENFELLHEVTPDLVTTPDVSELSLAVPKDVATGRNFELMLRRS